MEYTYRSHVERYPKFQIVSGDMISRVISKSKFQKEDVIQAIQTGGVPFIAFLNPEHVRHTVSGFLDFFVFDANPSRRRLQSSMTEKNQFFVPDSLSQGYPDLKKLGTGELEFNTPLQVKVDTYPNSVAQKNVVKVVTNSVDEAFSLFIPYGKGCIFLCPQLKDPIAGTKPLIEIVSKMLKKYNEAHQQMVESLQEMQMKGFSQYYNQQNTQAAKTSNQNKQDENPSLPYVEHVLKRFHKIARKLRKRHDKREPLIIKDEYDVQDLLKALFHMYFDDVRSEEWTPSHAGSSKRMDFLFSNDSIAVEVKYATEKNKDRKICDELVIDNEWYKKHPKCKTLIHFIYDPNEHLDNPSAIISDLQKNDKDLTVKVIVSPEK